MDCSHSVSWYSFASLAQAYCIEYLQAVKPPAEDIPKEIRLPQALERMLAFKDARVKQVGMKLEDLERLEKGEF